MTHGTLLPSYCLLIPLVEIPVTENNICQLVHFWLCLFDDCQNVLLQVVHQHSKAECQKYPMCEQQILPSVYLANSHRNWTVKKVCVLKYPSTAREKFQEKFFPIWFVCFDCRFKEFIASPGGILQGAFWIYHQIHVLVIFPVKQNWRMEKNAEQRNVHKNSVQFKEFWYDYSSRLLQVQNVFFQEGDLFLCP